MELHYFKQKKNIISYSSLEKKILETFDPDNSEEKGFASNEQIKIHLEKKYNIEITDNRLTGRIMQKNNFEKGVFYINRIKSRGFFLKLKT